MIVMLYLMGIVFRDKNSDLGLIEKMYGYMDE